MIDSEDPNLRHAAMIALGVSRRFVTKEAIEESVDAYLSSLTVEERSKINRTALLDETAHLAYQLVNPNVIKKGDP